MSQHTVTIDISGRKLKIACPVGEESALICAAAEVTLRINEANKKNKATNTPEQAMLMTALNLANDLLATREQMAREKLETQNKIQLLQSTIEQAIMSSQNKQA